MTDSEQALKKVSVNMPQGLFDELVAEADDFDLLVSEYIRNIVRTRHEEPEFPEMYCEACNVVDIPCAACPECGEPMDDVPEDWEETDEGDDDEE